jgi:hypothetical protein
MQTPTKLLLVGVTLAALIGLFGWFNFNRLESNLRAAQEKCEQANPSKQSTFVDPWACDAHELSQSPFIRLSGVQGEPHAQRMRSKHSPTSTQ